MSLVFGEASDPSPEEHQMELGKPEVVRLEGTKATLVWTYRLIGRSYSKRIPQHSYEVEWVSAGGSLFGGLFEPYAFF
jgi:hypothetical protein